jgi:hypothetical protein
MDRGKKFLAFAMLILLAFILQVVLIIADRREMPAKAAIEFTKAYFRLDKAMAERLCNVLSEEAGGDVVDDYLSRVAEKARTMGFELNYMKNTLSHIETATEMEDDNTAKVRIKANRRRYLNPFYGIIAKLFFLTETHKVDETLTLVKENGQWKVCEAPFSLVEL